MYSSAVRRKSIHEHAASRIATRCAELTREVSHQCDNNHAAWRNIPPVVALRLTDTLRLLEELAGTIGADSSVSAALDEARSSTEAGLLILERQLADIRGAVFGSLATQMAHLETRLDGLLERVCKVEKREGEQRRPSEEMMNVVLAIEKLSVRVDALEAKGGIRCDCERKTKEVAELVREEVAFQMRSWRLMETRKGN